MTISVDDMQSACNADEGQRGRRERTCLLESTA
jgi:hypothetical protein